jgi:hypothetical protein
VKSIHIPTNQDSPISNDCHPLSYYTVWMSLSFLAHRQQFLPRHLDLQTQNCVQDLYKQTCVQYPIFEFHRCTLTL